MQRLARISKQLFEPFKTGRPLWRRLAQWLLLIAAYVLALWAATQSRAAPQLILTAILYVVTLNFHHSVDQGMVSLVPIVTVSSFLILGFWPALVTLAISLVLAELTFPIWRPIWQNSFIDAPRPSWSDWGVRALVILGSLIIAGIVYDLAGGTLPLLVQLTDEHPVVSLDDLELLLADNLLPIIWLYLVYALSYFLLNLILFAGRRKVTDFVNQHAFAIMATSILAPPFGIFAAIAYAGLGLIASVFFGAVLTAFAQLLWLNWRRRFILEKQLGQVIRLNEINATLQETLDLNHVLQHIYQRINELISAEYFGVYLKLDDGHWQRYDRQQPNETPTLQAIAGPDDFTSWVFERAHTLQVDNETMHYATHHKLEIPEPTPSAWIGAPLTVGEITIGVVVLQRYTNSQPFTRWNRELLLAIAGQAAAALENARVHGETMRLYTQTDRALARRLEELQAILNSTHDGMLMLDTTGRIALVNPMVARLIGRPTAALREFEMDFALAAPALGYTDAELRQLTQQLSARQKPLAKRHVFKHRPAYASDNRQLFIERDETAVLAADGQIIGWLMVFRDVTEEMEQAEWRAELTRMIVHDLRNPVTTLTSTVNMIGDRLPKELAVDIGELVEIARRGCASMLDMVDSLMDINRMEAGQLIVEAEAMHLAPVISQVVLNFLPNAFEKQTELYFEHPESLPPIWGDEELLRRVFVNLLDNAVKFTPSGGRIYGCLAPEPPADDKHEPGLRCIISDTGPGIPPEYQMRVFDRFVSINPGGAQVRGTGLGLTFCKMVIEAHGGQIWVEEAEGGGTRFVFTLPGVPIF